MTNYVVKLCEACKKNFKVSEEWSYVKLCLPCYNLQKTSVPLVGTSTKKEESFNAIAMMATWRGICQLRQGKSTPTKKMITDAKMAYEELFEVK